jgi:hypothetical protein
VDLDDGSRYLDVQRVSPTPANFDELRSALWALPKHKSFSRFDAVVIDSATVAEEFGLAWTLENVPHEKGHTVKSIEGYGYGKGYTHNYEAFLLLLGDLDQLVRLGKHVVLIMHELTEKVPNPGGEDFLQYQPRLQSPPKVGKTRERVKEWLDHLFYISFDMFVTPDGKAEGSGSRTVYTEELPTHWAKSRLLSGTYTYDLDNFTLWHDLFQGGKT